MNDLIEERIYIAETFFGVIQLGKTKHFIFLGSPVGEEELEEAEWSCRPV